MAPAGARRASAQRAQPVLVHLGRGGWGSTSLGCGLAVRLALDRLARRLAARVPHGEPVRHAALPNPGPPLGRLVGLGQPAPSLPPSWAGACVPGRPYPALPGTPTTTNFCGAPEFEAMGSHSVFVSIGRGVCVDEAALAAALKSNDNGGS